MVNIQSWARVGQRGYAIKYVIRSGRKGWVMQSDRPGLSGRPSEPSEVRPRVWTKNHEQDSLIQAA